MNVDITRYGKSIFKQEDKKEEAYMYLACIHLRSSGVSDQIGCFVFATRTLSSN